MEARERGSVRAWGKALLIGVAPLLWPHAVQAQAPDSAAAYAAIVARQPDNSRAVFRLAALQPRGSARAIELYRRYVSLEPKDAWGHLALAEALAAANHYGEAMREIERADQLAPGNEDVAVVRKRVQKSQRQAVPTAQPRVAVTKDSDQNQLTQLSFTGDIASGPTSRFGAVYTHSMTGDGVSSFNADDGRLTLLSKTATTRFELNGGVAHVAAPVSFTTAVGRARLRASSSPLGALLDVRAQRIPLLVSPLLMVNQVVLSEARVTAELPLAGRVRIRGNAQLGDLASANIDTVTYYQMQQGMGRGRGSGGLTTSTAVVGSKMHNRRVGYGGALVTRVGAASEISANYYQLSYDAASKAGYFAPRLVQLAEIGTYSEIYKFDPVVIAFDVGAGIQRAAAQGAELGNWQPALRGWGQLSIPLGRAVELNLETDYYKSQLSTVSTSGSWSSLMGAVSLRWLVGY